VLIVLIPFLRKLITDKAETAPVEAATVVPVRLKILWGARGTRVERQSGSDRWRPRQRELFQYGRQHA
jgi:hypothetical protein